jgi:hypothetical protein
VSDSDEGRKPPPKPAIPRTLTPRTAPITQPPPPKPPAVHPIGTPKGLSTSAGSLAVAAWLAARGIYPPQGRSWRVQVALETLDRAASFLATPTRFHVTIDPEAWRYVFAHDDRTSTIHVASLPNAVDRDEHRLAALTPALKNLGTLLRDLEARYRIFFQRRHAAIRTDLPGSEPIIRAWIASL